MTALPIEKVADPPADEHTKKKTIFDNSKNGNTRRERNCSCSKIFCCSPSHCSKKAVTTTTLHRKRGRVRDEDSVIKFLTNQVDLKQLSWVILLTADNWQLAAVLANIQEVQCGQLKGLPSSNPSNRATCRAVNRPIFLKIHGGSGLQQRRTRDMGRNTYAPFYVVARGQYRLLNSHLGVIIYQLKLWSIMAGCDRCC